MTPDFTLPSYSLQADWAQRGESAASIAIRYLRYTAAFAAAHDVFDSWYVGSSRRSSRLEDVRDNLTPLVQKDVMKDDAGIVSPELGFCVSGRSRNPRQIVIFTGTVGSPLPMPYLNYLSLHTDFGFLPDPDINNYQIWRSICLATIASWEPLYCTASPSALRELYRDRRWYGESWFTYVHPSLVNRIEIPDIPVIERTPDGGLLLAAAADVFSVDNPDHIEAARRIADATAPLDAVMPPLL